MAREPKKEVNATDLVLPADTSLVLQGSGPVDRTDLILDGVDGPIANDQLDELAFMEEKIEVMVHESTDPNADNPVQVFCNGIQQLFFRGSSQVVRRKYVEVLARAKQTAVQTREVRAPDGELTTQITKTSSLRYPFSIIHDANPKGADWIRRVMREA